MSDYVRRARVSIAFQAAARAWSFGVPWGEALKAATDATAAARRVVPPPIRGRKGGGKGKGHLPAKGKGKGRGRGSG